MCIKYETEHAISQYSVHIVTTIIIIIIEDISCSYQPNLKAENFRINIYLFSVSGILEERESKPSSGMSNSQDHQAKGKNKKTEKHVNV